MGNEGTYTSPMNAMGIGWSKVFLWQILQEQAPKNLSMTSR